MAEFIIITGMSGSGKTGAMRFFEDREYFCIDNIPPILISRLLEVFAYIGDGKRKIALVIDMRVGEMINELLNQIEILRKNGYSCELLFMDSDDETLVKRYKETRRSHPIKAKGGLLESIHSERKMLAELYKAADTVIDTSKLKQMDLYNKLHEIYFKTDDIGLFNASIRYFEESGFEIISKTYDLHSEPIWKNNIETEHEKMFEEQGIKTKALIAKLK